MMPDPLFNNLIDVLRYRAQNQANQRLYTLLPDGENEEVNLTYKDLDQQAQAIALLLRQHIHIGERVLLLYPTCVEYITAFFGCLFAGVVPVPAFPPRLNRIDQRIQTIAVDARASLALTTPLIMNQMERRLEKMPSLANVRWLSTHYPVPIDEIGSWQEAVPASQSLAFIQYTSGSTANPKGVMVSHANLIRNLKTIQQAYKINYNGDDTGVTWAPLYHDSGLIMSILMALYAGAPLAILSPTAFAQRPVRWLNAISNYKGTISGGPNFAYQWCVDKITPEDKESLDLSSWKVAFCGAEPIREDTVNRFIETFAPHGFDPEAFTPIYGLAEATLMVSGQDKGRRYSVYHLQRTALEQDLVIEVDKHDATARKFVGCGQIPPDFQVAIVNPTTLARCPENTIGEIWVSNSSVALGYWDRPDETRTTFQAYLAGTGEGPFLRTGDLGFIMNREVVITGRLKDLIILNGRNFYAEDIELTIKNVHPSLQPDGGAAFSIDGGGQEQLVIVQEIKREYRHIDPNEITRAIRKALAEYHELAVYDVVLVKYRSIPRTTSNKIQRRACKINYLANSLERIGGQSPDARIPGADRKQGPKEVVLPRTPLEAAIASIWTEVLAVEQVGVFDNYFELGGNSLSATQVISRVEDSFHIQLPLSVFFEKPTVANLAEHIQHMRAKGKYYELPPVSLLDRSLPIPCSFAQERIWFIHQLDPQSSAYNIGLPVRLKGPLDKSALRECLSEVFRRHEILRTVFKTIDNQPMQVITPYSETMINRALTEFDIRNLPEAEQQTRALELAQEAFRAPFDLESGPLTRLGLIQISDQENIFLIFMHHIISDAWSLNQFASEIITLYNGFSAGKQAILPDLPVQYADYAAWQTDWLRGEVLERLLSYWRKQLDRVSVLELPTDRPRPLIQTYNGKTEVFTFPEDILHNLKRLSQQENVTLFMTLLSAFYVLLYRYTAQTDIAIGCPIANRNRVETERLIGMLANTLVIRLDLTGEPTFRELLHRLRRVMLDAYDHQDLPYSVLTSELNPERDTRFAPFTQVMFSLVDVPTPATSLEGITVETLHVDRYGAQFDLTMSITDLPFEKSISIEYNTDLFEAATIKRMMSHYFNLLQGIISDSMQTITRLPMLNEVERHQLLFEWNKTHKEFPDRACIHELFEAQAQMTQEKIALVFENQSLTYAQLNMKANQLAHFLRRKGVKRGALVGIHLPRSLDLVIAVLGILKIGAVYVPLDPSYPALRLAFMIADSDTTLVLSDSSLAGSFADHDIEVFFLDQEKEQISLEPSENPACDVASTDLAYIIYTSGSTGKPKGVPISHRSVVNFLVSMREKPGLTSDDVLLAITTLSFDIALLELFLPLIVGAKVVLVRREIINDGHLLSQTISDMDVTVMQATPATWNLVLEAGWKGSQRLKILCGGEALSRDLADQLLPRCAELWNMYGPTETTIWSSIEQIRTGGEAITIGRPIANTEMYILDDSLEPVPVGITGMLYIGGEGLSSGYLNRPELNANKFVLNPFQPGANRRLFVTGDLARYLTDGRIECLGRNDSQIKIYGFRVELGEIETVLSEHPAVRKSVVVVHEGGSGQKSLIAYIISQSEQLPPGSELRSFLREKLPGYMIPSSFVVIETFPLTPSGKLDRQALQTLTSLSEEVYVAPRNAIERELANIWEEVLNTSPIGMNKNFFELGGYSLQAIRLLNSVENVFGIKLPVATIFQYPTVESMALIIESKAEHPDWSIIVPIQPKGSKPPIFCVHGAGGGVIGYSKLANWLGPDQPLYGIQAKGFNDDQEPHRQIEDMARAYLTAIKTIQPHGPYCLLGYSFGGIVAYELACQLKEQGEYVALLAILDAYALSRSWALKQLWRPKNLIKFILNIPPWLIDQWQVRSSRDYKQEIPDEFKRLFQAHVNSLLKYHPRIYDGKITLFRVPILSLLRSFDPELGWEELARGGVETHLISGSHAKMLDDPYVENLARIIKSCLDRV